MRNIFPLFFLIVSVFSCSQNKHSTIKEDFTKYIVSIQNKKIDEAVNCIYPKFFEIVPKEQMKRMLELTYNNPQLALSINKFNIDNIKSAEKINNEFYTTVDYTFDIDIKINSGELKNKMDLLQKGLESKFGSENVKFNDLKQSFNIHSSKKAIGISNNGITDWKFVVMENEYKPYLLRILPKKVIEEN